jgi:hypothetical protein
MAGCSRQNSQLMRHLQRLSAICHHGLLPHCLCALLCCAAVLFCCALLLQSFEALNQRAVAVVVDPVQSVKGKVVIDAFRLISPQVGGACSMLRQ